jgi:predicted RNase H-like HicB family nuclease
MTYTVEVTREGDTWIADVVDVRGAHTDARNLATLAERVQEVIGLVLDRPEDERFEVHFEYHGVDDDFLEAARIGDERAELEEHESRLADLARVNATKLSAKGWSVRDISGALRMSPGRVSQIVDRKDRRTRSGA